MEILHGDTPDTSMFRFKFWEPVWYYENPAKWPNPRKLTGRWIGIAWNHGDHFTYKVWTTPDDDWRKGREIIRNVVMRRDDNINLPDFSDTQVSYESFSIDKVKKLKRKGRKRKRVSSAENVAANARDLNIPDAHIDLPQPSTSVNDDVSETSLDDDNTDDAMSNFNPQEGGDLEMVNEITNETSAGVDPLSSGGGSVVEIRAHRWKEGQLQFEILWNTEETTWEEFRDLKEDKPRLAAKYIIDNNIKRSKRGLDRNFQWAKKTLRDLERATRRLRRLYDFYLDESDHVRYIRRLNNKRKKKKFKGYTRQQLKYGIVVPRTVK